MTGAAKRQVDHVMVCQSGNARKDLPLASYRRRAAAAAAGSGPGGGGGGPAPFDDENIHSKRASRVVNVF